MKTDATNSQNFYGLLSFDVPATDDGYQVKSATLRLVTPNVTFKGEDLVPQLTIVYEKSGTTGISPVNAEKIDDDTYYNLQGVKMNPNNLPHGIYIHQGKKVVK